MPSLRKRPSPLMEVRIVDDAMNDCPIGQPGECIVRGPSVMSGYLDDACRQCGGVRRRMAAYRRSVAQGSRWKPDLRRSQALSDQDRRRERLSRRGRGGAGAPSCGAGSLHLRRSRSALGRDDQGRDRAARGRDAQRRRDRRRSAGSASPATNGLAISSSSRPNGCRAARPASCNGTSSPNGRSARTRRSDRDQLDARCSRSAAKAASMRG